MLFSTFACVKWNSKNKMFYMQKGYRFTKMGDDLVVSLHDLKHGSKAKVTVKCDYCGKMFPISWGTYLEIKGRSTVPKDACRCCCELKANETIEQKYGGHSAMFYSSNEKRVATNIERFGCKNPFASEAVKQIIYRTNIAKYGVKHNQQSPVVRAKTIATCNERYGVDHYVELFRGKFIRENSPVWKGGVAYSRVERATYEYGVWRESVFRRDHYSCKKCGARNGNGVTVRLNAHHIKNWRDNIDLRYDTDNGITLCNDCHTAFHSKYGKRNTTPEQLREFLSESDEKIC